MLYKGYKIKVRCIDWEQIETLDNYWNFFTSYVNFEEIIGLGMNWTDDYFEYALGVIDDDIVLQKLKAIEFSKNDYDVEYIEIQLPELVEWQSFKGKDENVKQIYEEYIDCYNLPYDYELEYIDGKGNIEIKIHYIRD